jgi:hypothetical protein
MLPECSLNVQVLGEVPGLQGKAQEQEIAGGEVPKVRRMT